MPGELASAKRVASARDQATRRTPRRRRQEDTLPETAAPRPSSPSPVHQRLLREHASARTDDLACVFPTLTVINFAFGDRLRTMSPVTRTSAIATIAVPIVIHGLMPHVHRLRVRL